MTSSASVLSRPVLADRLITRSLATDAALVVAGTALTALLAQVVIPMYPVPITGQTLAVLLVGGSLGAVRGSLSMVLYILIGSVGVPVFSEASSGVDVVFGATGGYMIGFILAAALTGWLAARSWDRRFLGGMVSYLAGSALVFVVGLPWLAAVGGYSLSETLAYGLYPFIIGGVIKAAIAAGLIRAGWFAVGRKADRTA